MSEDPRVEEARSQFGDLRAIWLDHQLHVDVSIVADGPEEASEILNDLLGQLGHGGWGHYEVTKVQGFAPITKHHEEPPVRVEAQDDPLRDGPILDGWDVRAL